VILHGHSSVCRQLWPKGRGTCLGIGTGWRMSPRPRAGLQDVDPGSVSKCCASGRSGFLGAAKTTPGSLRCWGAVERRPTQRGCGSPLLNDVDAPEMEAGVSAPVVAIAEGGRVHREDGPPGLRRREMFDGEGLHVAARGRIPGDCIPL